MTNKEYVTTICSKFGLDTSEIDVILINQAKLVGNVDEEVTSVSDLKMAIANEFANLIPLANVSEGGYSVSWNLDAIKSWYKATCAELGITDKVTQPKVKNRSNIW